jgi:hypothetical protein
LLSKATQPHPEDKKLGSSNKYGAPDKMSAAVISRELRIYGRQRWPLDNDKRRKERLAALLNLTGRRIKSLWEGAEAAVPRAHEVSAIERLIGKRIGAAEEANSVRASQAEYRALEARIAALEAAFAVGDEEFGRAHLDGLRAQASGRGQGFDGGSPANGRPHSGLTDYYHDLSD